MIRTIIWFAYFFGSLLCLTPKCRQVKRLREQGEDDKAQAIVNQYVARWAHRVMKVAGVRVTVQGQENIPQGNAVFTPNHQSDFDIPVMLTILNQVVPLLAKIELKKVPGLSAWMEQIRCVFIDRQDEKEAARAVITCAKMVKNGSSMIVFPEGTRSKGGPVKEFKGGAFRVATRAGVPVVPITIDGTWHSLEERHHIHPGQVTVTIHPAIETKGMSKEEQAQLPERVRQQVLTALPEQYRA